MHLFLILAERIPQLFLCLVRDTADICEASPAFRVIVLTVACAFLLLAQYPVENRRSAFVLLHIPDNILFGVSKTVANQFLFH